MDESWFCGIVEKNAVYADNQSGAGDPTNGRGCRIPERAVLRA